MKKYFLLILLTILFGYSLSAQNSALRDSVSIYKYNFSRFGNETWNYIKQPTKWDGKDWLTIGLIGAGTFLIIETADNPIRNVVLKNQQYHNSVPVKIGNMWGDWYPTVIIGSAFAIHGWAENNSSSAKIAFEILQAGIYTEFVTQLIKNTFGRARPFKELGPTTFKPFSLFKWDFTSMPAGHTTWAVALSTVLSRNAKPGWLKVLAYIPSALTFIARVYTDNHWTSDNFLGAATSYFIATWVVDQHEKNNSKVEMSSLYPISIRIAF